MRKSLMSFRQNLGVLVAAALVGLLVTLLILVLDQNPADSGRGSLSLPATQRSDGLTDRGEGIDDDPRSGTLAAPLPLDPASVAVIHLSVQVVRPAGSAKEPAEVRVWEVRSELPLAPHKTPDASRTTDPESAYYDERFARPDPAWNAPVQVENTDEQGTCRFELRLEQAVVVAAFLADGSSSGKYLVTPALDGPTDISVKLWIRSPGFIAGSVVDAAQQPVAGATIAFDPELDRTRRVTPRKPKSVVTGADGMFATAVDAPFFGRLRAECAGRAGPPRNVSVIPEETETIELSLDEPMLIEGIVRTSDGRNAAGAIVRCLDARGSIMTVTADAIGSFAVVPDATGRFELRASSSELVTPAAVVVTCIPGATRQTCELIVAPGDTIAGEVIDPSGAPVADCEVVAVFEEAGAGSWPGRIAATASTDAAGHFEVGPLPMAAICKLSAAASQQLCGSLNGVRSGSKGVQVRLARGLSLRGRIVGTDGEPLMGGHVTLRRVERGIIADGLFREWAMDAPQGRFSWTALEAGAYQVNVSAPNCTSALVQVDVALDDQEVVVRMERSVR